MTTPAATEFAKLWTFLGENHGIMDEEILMATEEKLFQLKTELNPTDYPYILETVDQTKALKKELLHFLQ